MKTLLMVGLIFSIALSQNFNSKVLEKTSFGFQVQNYTAIEAEESSSIVKCTGYCTKDFSEYWFCYLFSLVSNKFIKQIYKATPGAMFKESSSVNDDDLNFKIEITFTKENITINLMSPINTKNFSYNYEYFLNNK